MLINAGFSKPIKREILRLRHEIEALIEDMGFQEARATLTIDCDCPLCGDRMEVFERGRFDCHCSNCISEFRIKRPEFDVAFGHDGPGVIGTEDNEAPEDGAESQGGAPADDLAVAMAATHAPTAQFTAPMRPTNGKGRPASERGRR